MAKKKRAWDQMPKEPALWFGRFSIYKSLGYTRTVEATHREDPSVRAKRPSRQWSQMSKKWQWAKRAEAWDHHLQLTADQKLTRRAVNRAERQYEISVKLLDAAETILANQEALAAARTRDAARLADVAMKLGHDSLAGQRSDDGISPQAPGAPAFTVVLPDNQRGTQEQGPGPATK